MDRSAVPPPEVLVQRGTAEFERAKAFYHRDEKERRQERFVWKVYAAREVREALVTLFHGKCAYCESRILVARPEIEHQRPKAGVVRPDGTLLPDHYWWLALEWSNLYLSCSECNRARSSAGVERLVGKGTRFPLVDERNRAPLEAVGEQLEREKPLLLDPCAKDPEDRPERHLVFLEDGTVVSDTQQGQTTIETLMLNRVALVDARRKSCREVQQQLAIAAGLVAKDQAGLAKQLDRLAVLMQPNEEYAGLKRQLVGSLLQTLEPERPVSDSATVSDSVTVSKQRVRRAKSAQRQFVEAQQHYSLTDKSGDEVYRSVTRRIDRVVIHNLKAIQHVDLRLSRSSSTTAPWTVLLGENGTGKSTVLQALAIALVGEQEVNRLKLDASEFVRKAPRVTKASIDVYLTGSRYPRRVVLTSKGFEFIRSAEPQTLVLGYGETRMFRTPGLRPATGSRACRVEALFRPARSLVDADAWLRRVPEATFEYVGGALQDLLDLPRQRWLERSTGHVCVREPGGPLSLRELSTGYQSVLATVVDILELTLKLWPTPETAEGIVLLDELGAHLHPTWRMRVVSGLRRMLPAMQFVATTHEPLCLRGLEDNEVVLMQRDNRYRAFATADLPSPRDLRVDQLLTSRHFGLSTTLDPKIDEEFARYYDLLSYDDDQLDATQRSTRDELARSVRRHGVLGYTRRDQLVYEAIDTFLAQERRAIQTHQPPPVRAETVRRITELWGLANLAEGTEEFRP